MAVIIPVLIHLFNFRKFKVVYFSNVQFLKAVKEQHSSREKLKNLLILFARILAIVFLVLAFARPYFSSGTDHKPGLTNMVNIYIDNSYSMENQNKEGSLLDEAKRRAKEIAKGFSPNDRFQLTTNDFEGKHQRKLNVEELIQQIDEVKISPAQRSLQQVLNRQQAGETGATANYNSYSYILSDFQQHFAGRGLNNGKLKSDSNTSVSLVRLSANAQPNVAVDSIWSLSPAHRPNDQERFVVQLHNYGEENSGKVALKLTVNHQQKGLTTVNIPAGKSVRDTLSFSGLAAGWQKGIVSIKDFPITFDDTLNFSFKVNAELPVLHISAVAGGATKASSTRYISSLFSADPYFRLTTMPESNITYSAFSAYPLIIVSGLKSPSSGLAGQLRNHVKNGGAVAIFPDLDASPAVYTTFLNSLSLPGVERLSQDTLTVNSIDLKSNLFSDVFEQLPAQLDLPRVNRHFVYTQNNKSSREDIMGLPFRQLFFSRYHLGAGQIYLSSTSLESRDSNLPLHAVFVPLMYKVAFLSVQEQPLYYTLGSNLQLSSKPLQLKPDQPVKLSSARLEVIPELRQQPGKTLLYIADQLKSTGFYELKKADSLLAVYAFNDNRLESDMHYMASSSLEALLTKKNITINNSGASIVAGGIKNNHTELWKLCIVLCAVFLALEVILTQFFNNPKNILRT
ncbi:BatA domain-containing protein [Pedobacter sp. AW31-3R]|uniref:BatA domain-containing protein n=1 Tax=Pedobacter sp. AW31-3R TaxID=3445781 RepID=UPI003F9EE50A